MGKLIFESSFPIVEKEIETYNKDICLLIKVESESIPSTNTVSTGEIEFIP